MASGSTNSCKVVIKLEKIQEEIQVPPSPVEDFPNHTPDYDFVDQPDQDYYCPVSLELLTQPLQTLCCGHHISQQAVDILTRDNKPCPMCKEDNIVTHMDKFFRRKVRQLKVHCPNKKSGCDWKGELGDYNYHTTSCSKRPWKCPYCPFQSTHDIGTTDHAPQCDYQPVPCPNQCQVDNVPYCEVEKHLLTCSLQLVDCEFASIGCDVRVPRKDLAGHMTENTQHHIMNATLLNLKLTRDLHQKMEEKDNQIAKLKEELKAKIDTKTSDLNIKLQQLESKLQEQMHELDTKLTQSVEAQHKEHMQMALKLSISTVQTLTLTEFTKHQAKGGAGEWLSDPFYNYPGGYKFQLNIDTNGHDSAKGTHFSTFLLLCKGHNDEKLHWPVTLEVTLDMLNQENNDYYSVTEVLSFEKTNHTAYKCIGSTYKFYPLAQLKQNHYLKNDELKYRLWLKVIP